MLEQLEHIFHILVQYGILFLEFSGVVILLLTAARSIWRGFVRKQRIQLYLARGIALALEFKLGSEVLRTTVVRDTGELLILGAIILLRAALTVLIHWEIRHEESRSNAKDPAPL